jgi:hypothetical protein
MPRLGELTAGLDVAFLDAAGMSGGVALVRC